ncbi:hypothetical protein E2I00_006044, partial [Balaenoptera physalus]
WLHRQKRDQAQAHLSSPHDSSLAFTSGHTPSVPPYTATPSNPQKAKPDTNLKPQAVDSAGAPARPGAAVEGGVRDWLRVTGGPEREPAHLKPRGKARPPPRSPGHQTQSLLSPVRVKGPSLAARPHYRQGGEDKSSPPQHTATPPASPPPSGTETSSGHIPAGSRWLVQPETVCPVRCWCGGSQAILSRNAQDGCRGLGGGLRIKDGGAPPKGQGEDRPKRLLLLSRLPGPHIPPSVITLLPSTGVTSPRLLRGSLSPNNPASPPVSVPFKAGARLGC